MSSPPLSDNSAVAALSARIADAAYIALDTEFLRERTYRPQLCLVQLATSSEVHCIDPLGEVTLAPLAPALHAPAIPKILHAARQDLEVLWPLFGSITPIFDTQIAAALTGLPAQIGYSELVRRLLGVDLAKAHTRTDWSQRPLSAEQLAYAIDDVAHLAGLRDALLQQLEQLGRLAWLQEELLDLARPERLFVEPDKAVERLRWTSELDPDRWRLAQQLAAWRERRAAEKDRPRNWILDDAALRALVMNPPRDAPALAAVQELTPGFVERTGPRILELIAGAALPKVLPPPAQRSRPDPQHLARVKQLGVVLQKLAEELAIAPEVLATRRDLESIARGETTADVLQGWRRAAAGQTLLAAG
jgi:ribonuclease D